MAVEILLARSGAAPERRPLAAAASAGGSRADGLFVAGLAPGALRLVPVAAGVVVEACAAGVRVSGRSVPPGTRRLLRPGERAELDGVVLALAPAAPAGAGTRCAAAALLRDAAAGEVPSAARLVVLTGPDAGARHVLGAEQTLGRGRAATIRLADPRASRVHARVRAGAAGVTLEDLRSKNGVRVNGVRIDRRPVALGQGAEIAVGDTLLAVEQADAGAAVDVQPSPGARARRAPPLARALPRLAAALLLALSAAALALAAS